MISTGELVQAGRLEEALAALQAEVKKRPTDAEKRFELGELLLALGEWSRADSQFDIVSTQDPSFGVKVALLRQLIRGEIARLEVFEQGRAPDLVTDPTPEIGAGLRRLLDLHDPNVEQVEAAEEGPSLHGTVDGRPFEGVRDLDDRVAGVLEVLSSTGKYFWIPWSSVTELELEAPQRLRDLIWRPANLDVRGGPSGVVYIPATYVAPSSEQTSATRLGRETQWIEEKGLVRGVGLRCLLLGETDVSLAEFTSLSLVDERGHE